MILLKHFKTIKINFTNKLKYNNAWYLKQCYSTRNININSFRWNTLSTKIQNCFRYTFLYYNGNFKNKVEYIPTSNYENNIRLQLVKNLNLETRIFDLQVCTLYMLHFYLRFNSTLGNKYAIVSITCIVGSRGNRPFETELFN